MRNRVKVIIMKIDEGIHQHKRDKSQTKEKTKKYIERTAFLPTNRCISWCTVYTVVTECLDISYTPDIPVI